MTCELQRPSSLQNAPSHGTFPSGWYHAASTLIGIEDRSQHTMWSVSSTERSSTWWSIFGKLTSRPHLDSAQRDCWGYAWSFTYDLWTKLFSFHPFMRLPVELRSIILRFSTIPRILLMTWKTIVGRHIQVSWASRVSYKSIESLEQSAFTFTRECSPENRLALRIHIFVRLRTR